MPLVWTLGSNVFDISTSFELEVFELVGSAMSARCELTVDSWMALGLVSDQRCCDRTLAKTSAFIILRATQVPARSDNVCGFG